MNVSKHSAQATGNGPTEQAGNLPTYSKRERAVAAVTADTWGGSTSVALEGTHDGTSWFPMASGGTPITFTSNGCAEVPATLGYRINVSSIAGTTNMQLTVVR